MKVMHWAVFSLTILAFVGCRQDMHDQPRYEPLEAGPFFDDGRAAQPQVEGTIARGELKLDKHLHEGKVNGELAKTFPFEVTADVLARGRERYDIYCTPCHGVAGLGDGIIVSRGFPAPPSFHLDRLRTVEAGHFFDVITNGFGRMYSYEDRVNVEDRWAIAAYVRVLQRSRDATMDDVPPQYRAQLKELGK